MDAALKIRSNAIKDLVDKLCQLGSGEDIDGGLAGPAVWPC